MKKSIFILALLLSSLSFHSASAQIKFQINIGQQPVWGPSGYDYAEYYYFPESDIYYNIPQQQFLYFDGRRWINTSMLPARYQFFDPFTSYKVVINEPYPYLRHDVYRRQYVNFRAPYQQIILNSREPKYYVIERHPEHNRWLESNRSNNYNNDRRTGFDRNNNNDRRTGFDRNNNNDSRFNRNDNRFNNNSYNRNETRNYNNNSNRGSSNNSSNFYGQRRNESTPSVPSNPQRNNTRENDGNNNTSIKRPVRSSF